MEKVSIGGKILDLRYFFNAGYDRETNECDLEGTDVFDDGHYIGSVKWYTPTDLNGMGTEEIYEIFVENGILV